MFIITRAIPSSSPHVLETASCRFYLSVPSKLGKFEDSKYLWESCTNFFWEPRFCSTIASSFPLCFVAFRPNCDPKRPFHLDFSLSLSLLPHRFPSFLPSSSPSPPPHEKAAHFLHYYPSRIAASTQLNCLLSILFGQREGERADRLQSGNLPRKAISYSASRSLS